MVCRIRRMEDILLQPVEGIVKTIKDRRVMIDHIVNNQMKQVVRSPLHHLRVLFEKLMHGSD